MQCDLCGKSMEDFFKIKTEGTILNVCESCSGHGEIIQEVKAVIEDPPKKEIFQKPPKPEIVEELVEGYQEKIKKKREKLGLKQEDFAKKINEKESILQKVESGHFIPSLKLATKIENFLGIKLIEEVEEEKMIINRDKSDGEGFTLGDFVKKKS